MIGLIRLLLRFVWLTLFILGVRRALEIGQSGIKELIDRIDKGESGSIELVLTSLHEALHRRQAHRSGGDDALGEM